MRGPTRRISFYLKPEVVKSEKEACDYLDSLPASERSRAQRAAFLAGLALLKHNPAQAYWMAEWQELSVANISNIKDPTRVSGQEIFQPHREVHTPMIKKNIKALFPD